MMEKFAEIKDYNGVLKTDEIPVLSYADFGNLVDEILVNPANHCISYFAVTEENGFRMICLMGCDEEHAVKIFSHRIIKDEIISSLTSRHFALHVFEREMHERHAIHFSGHPWLKPVRHPKGAVPMDEYPFYSIASDELHEVGVGPVHAGVIEPGHFRFICNGEKVLHLEIQLGYQHRGVEDLFTQKQTLLQKNILAESIAGDTVTGHATAFVNVIESLAGVDVPDNLLRQRMIALEMERMAVHIGDTAALCTDTAYQFGQVVCEALRTIVINTTQAWCGNRFGKGFIRPGGTNYPLTPEVILLIRKNLQDVIFRYDQIAYKIFSIPSVLNRFEGIGKVTSEQAALIGAVGMAARSSGLKRDVRWSFPVDGILKDKYEPVVFRQGDVWARGMVRREEVRKSYQLILDLLDQIENSPSRELPLPDYTSLLQPDSLAFGLTEGWRGEICHIAITDSSGKIKHYKAKDPSLHNWMALALAVRDQEISDFPLCNKSYNLSYCGHDL